MEPDLRSPLTQDERRKMARAAALRPINLLVLLVGAGSFVATGAWWTPLLTLATYAILVALAARDPIFRRRVLRPGENGTLPTPRESRTPRAPRTTRGEDVSPERRVRWLPRGETRTRVEEALVVYRKVVGTIEGSDGVTRAVLEDAVPKLHATADRLVDVARGRERAAETLQELRGGRAAPARPPSEDRTENLRLLEERVRKADAEIEATSEKLLDLRAKAVRVALDSGNPQQPATFNSSLDELDARLEALNETLSPE